MSAETRPQSGLADSAQAVVLLLGLGAILMLAKEIIVPLALAILLSFALSPVVRALQKVGLPRGLGAVVALALFMAALAVWVWFVSAQMADLAQQLPAYRHNIFDKIHGLTQKFGGGGGDSGLASMFEDTVKEVTPTETAANAPQRVVVVDNSPFARITLLGAFASPALSPIGQFFIVLIFTAFLLAQQEDLRNRVIKLIGSKDIYRTTEAIDDAGRRIGRMLFAQVVMNSSFGLFVAAALWAIGVPNPALWGAIAALARFVPYVGVLIGAIPPLLVAFAFAPGWTAFVLTAGVFVVAESITGQLIEPIVYGHSSGLSPMAVVVMTALWGFLWGPIGLVLAVPLTTCLVVLGRHSPRLAFIETLLGDEPPLTAQETFYQRMLAGDPREAAAQAKPYLKRDAIADYYDEVALEALRRAHVDVARGDLDEGRLEALTRSTERLVAWLGAHGVKNGRWRTLLRRLAPLAATRGVVAVEARQDALLSERRGVAVLHGDHPLDPLAASMLSHALTRRGLPSRVVTAEAYNMASSAENAAVGLVCLCYIEPMTVAHLRAAAVEARRRCPQAKILICVWRDPGDETFVGWEKRLRCDAVATGVGAAGAAALRLLGVGAAPWSFASMRATAMGPRARAA
jgi:predicted PurR-regulated permease PerM